MHAIGVDLSERGARAVAIDEAGAVLRASTVSGHQPASDAREAALEAAQTADRIDAPVGIAVDAEDRAAADSTLKGIAAAGAVSAPGAAAVTAEAWVGAARGARHAVALWLGDRVLAGILLDGVPWLGARGLAGSAAWLALNPVERQDYRKFGSLAAEVSNKGIARRLSWRIQAGDHSAVLERAGDLDAITAWHVFEGARAGDGVAISVVRDTAKYIGMAIANLASAIDPEVVVLAGPVAAAGDLLLEPVRQECARRLPPRMADGFRCEISPLGEDAIAIGAARLAALRAR
jgi:predicted NBD/HSP70 family sugar kinase